MRIADDILDDVETETIDTLLNKTMAYHRCTPLYQFMISQLPTYSKQLREYLSSRMRSGYTLEDDEGLEDTAPTGGKLQNLEIQPIQIQWSSPLPFIITVDYLSNRPNSRIQTYHFAFFSASRDADFASYPSILAKSTIALSRLVFEWIQTRFDCRISKGNYTSADLTRVLQSMAGSPGASLDLIADRSVELAFAAPSFISPDLKTITMTVGGDVALDLVRQGAIAGDNSILTPIYHYFHHHFRIHLDRLTLCRVGIGIVYIAGREGKVKLLKTEAQGATEAVTRILQLLVDISS